MTKISGDFNPGIYAAWVPTLTGFSADPTNVVAMYTLIGKMCHCYYRATNGTSNATETTVTLPFAAANTGLQGTVCMVTNNATSAAGRMLTRLNSNIADLYPSQISNTWMASGTKGMTFLLTYEIA